MENNLIPLWMILLITLPVVTLILVCVYKYYIIPQKVKELISKNENEEISKLKEQIACLKSSNDTLNFITQEFTTDEYSKKVDTLNEIIVNIPKLSTAQNNEEFFYIIDSYLREYIFTSENNEQKSLAYANFSQKLKKFIDSYWNIIELRKNAYDITRSFEKEGEPPLSIEKYKSNMEKLLSIVADSYCTFTDNAEKEENRGKLNALINNITSK